MKTLTLLLTAVMLLTLAVGCSNRSSNTSSYPPPQSYPPDQTYPQSGQNYPSGPTVASTGGNGVIPAGTQLAIRTNERIDARDGTSTGRDYDAEVANDIVNDRGEVLVPRGSDAKLTVLRSDKNDLVLGVRELEVKGRRYSVQSGEITRGGGTLGANKETVKHVGGGALLGTLVGAMAGGAKGAAVGAAVGAAGGAAVQVLTKGREVNVPAETILTFRLDEPLSLYEYSGSNY